MPPKRQRLEKSASQERRILSAESGFPHMFNDIMNKFISTDKHDEFKNYIQEKYIK